MPSLTPRGGPQGCGLYALGMAMDYWQQRQPGRTPQPPLVKPMDARVAAAAAVAAAGSTSSDEDEGATAAAAPPPPMLLDAAVQRGLTSYGE